MQGSDPRTTVPTQLIRSISSSLEVRRWGSGGFDDAEQKRGSEVKSSKLRMFLGVTVLALAVALPATASAQSSSVDAYGGDGNAVVGVSGGGGGSNGPPSSDSGTGPNGSVSGTGANGSGTLPFTGMDVSLLAGGGILLLLIGVGMARITARPRSIN